MSGAVTNIFTFLRVHRYIHYVGIHTFLLAHTIHVQLYIRFSGNTGIYIIQCTQVDTFLSVRRYIHFLGYTQVHKFLSVHRNIIPCGTNILKFFRIEGYIHFLATNKYIHSNQDKQVHIFLRIHKYTNSSGSIGTYISQFTLVHTFIRVQIYIHSLGYIQWQAIISIQ